MGRIAEFRAGPRRTLAQPGNIAQAGRVARDIAGTIRTVSAVQDKIKRVQDNDYINQKSLEMENAGLQLFEQHKLDNAGNPFETFGKLNEGLNDSFKDMIENAPSLAAKEMLSKKALRFSEQMKQHNFRWEKEQTVNNTGATTLDGLNAIQTEALRGKDTRILDLLEAKGEAFISNLEEVANPEIVKVTRDNFRKNITVNAFQGMIQSGQLDEAEKRLNSKEHDERLGADNVFKIQNSINAQRKQLKSQAENLEKMKFTDPWKFLGKVGETTPPLDIEHPSTFARRETFTEASKEKYGMEVPLMSKTEVLEFEQFMSTGDIDEKVGKLQDLAQAMTPEQYTKFSDQVFEKSKELGAAMSISTESPDLAAEIITGKQLVDSKSIKLGTGADELVVRNEFNKQLNVAIRDPEARDSIFFAVRAITVSRSFKKGGTAIEASEVKQSLFDLLGEPIEVNGRNTLTFKSQGVFVEDLDDVFEGTTAKEILKVHKELPTDNMGNVIDQEDLVDDFTLEVVGDGVYYLLDETGAHAMNSKKERYELNLKEIHERRTVTRAKERKAAAIKRKKDRDASVGLSPRDLVK